MPKRSDNSIQPLPFVWYYVPVLGLCLLGLVVSLYLSISHYRVYTDIGYSSFCAISKAVNCDTVSQSPYSIFLGMPVPLWGVFGYIIYLIGCIAAGMPAFRPKGLWRILLVIAAIFSFISIFLALISSFVIRSYCIMCIVTYGVNFALLFYTWLIPNRFDHLSFWKGLTADFRAINEKKKIFAGIAVVFSIFFMSSWTLIPPYWKFAHPSNIAEVEKGFTEDGHPWIGAANPEITIVEFTDYQCFQCKKMHYHLRSLINRYPDRVRLVHRHYPMDHTINPIVKEPFHEGSAVLAALAIQAGFKNKFWEANDELYRMAGQVNSIDTGGLAKKIGLNPKDLEGALEDPKPLKKLIRDIREGMKLGIAGTPSYVIDGIVYKSQIPAKKFSGILSAKDYRPPAVKPVENTGD